MINDYTFREMGYSKVYLWIVQVSLVFKGLGNLSERQMLCYT